MFSILSRARTDLQNYIVEYLESKELTEINIVYIGANDGVYTNPLYDIMRWNSERINILISEPQEELSSILHDHLYFLNKKTITSTLINDGENKTFYSIKPEHYERFQFAFLKNYLPVYVSPTVISGCNKSFFLKKYYDEGFNPMQLPWEKYVNVTQKPSQKLPFWLSGNNFLKPIDILLIMAQGEDATILYNNDWDKVQPNIIVCDNTNWEQENISELFAFLESKHYECSTINSYIQLMVAKKINKNEE